MVLRLWAGSAAQAAFITRFCTTSHTDPNSGILGQPSLEAGGAKKAKCFCEDLELGIMPPAKLIHNGDFYTVKQDPVEFLSTLGKPLTPPLGYVILHGAKDWVTEGTLVNTAEELFDADRRFEVAFLEDCFDKMAGRGFMIWLDATLPSLGGLPAMKSICVGSRGEAGVLSFSHSAPFSPSPV
ncbi:hypothetical protein CABS02_14780 [Colletotrichum abscissum]|uniref:Uncharacterized protein n=1 Tax=Colletotrichum abscissum TaxID=1671311 RepID=A0A9P9X0M6_9PEZI|nr:hypothetical protein CABS02_14780 [Colletotrichum abscissum]